MAIKQKVYKFDNGATLIYQKQPKDTNTSLLFGFSCGAKVDDKNKGLSHLIEHLFFRGESDKGTKKILNDFMENTIDSNAFTTKHCICHEICTTDAKFENALNTCIKSITKRRISQDEIKKEVEVVKHEILLYKDKALKHTCNPLNTLLGSLIIKNEEDIALDNVDILGNPRTLNAITPQIVNDYVKKYFNTDNLIISVSSNKSQREVIDILNRTVFNKLPRAKSKKYIVPLPKPHNFSSNNALITDPNHISHNVQIDLLLRARNKVTRHPEKEIAYSLMEEQYLNSITGLLYEKLRVENQLVYASDKDDLNFGTACYKRFYALTNATKMRKTIRVLCDLIYDLGVNGFPKDKFEKYKQLLLDSINDQEKARSGFAYGNYVNYLRGFGYLDSNLIISHIKNMEYEDFNKAITTIYQKGNVSLAVKGLFDSRKMYKLIEIESMLGNTKHIDDFLKYNIPNAEFTKSTGGLSASLNKCNNSKTKKQENERTN